MAAEEVGHLVGFLDCVACCEDLAVGGVDELVDEVATQPFAGSMVDVGSVVYKRVKLHYAVAGHIVEQEGEGETAVDSQLLELLDCCFTDHK